MKQEPALFEFSAIWQQSEAALLARAKKLLEARLRYERDEKKAMRLQAAIIEINSALHELGVER